MPKKKTHDPLASAAILTGLGFDFHKEFVVVTAHYPAEIEHIQGPQKQARFLVPVAQMEELGAKFIEAGQLALRSLKPEGSA